MGVKSQENKDFYKSFTIVCSKGKKSLELTARNSFDFEAWLMGLSFITKITPAWGCTLSDLGTADAIIKLSKDEIEICSVHHITANKMLLIKETCKKCKKLGYTITKGQIRHVDFL